MAYDESTRRAIEEQKLFYDLRAPDYRSACSVGHGP